MSFEWLFLIAIVAGLVGALGGMGAGVVLIPVMTAFGIDIKQAIVISNLSVIAVSASTAVGDVRRHVPNLKIISFLELFAVTGAFSGALIALLLDRRILFLFCGVAFLACSFFLWRQQKRRWKSLASQDAFSRQLGWEGSYYDHVERQTVSYQGTRAALAGPLMFGAGAISTLLGFGGNAITVLIHDVVIGLPPKVSLTMSNLIIGVIAIAGVNVYLEGGLINPNLVVPVIPGIILGALIGSKALVYFPNQVVRRIFLVVLTLLGLELMISGLRGKL